MRVVPIRVYYHPRACSKRLDNTMGNPIIIPIIRAQPCRAQLHLQHPAISEEAMGMVPIWPYYLLRACSKRLENTMGNPIIIPIIRAQPCRAQAHLRPAISSVMRLASSMLRCIPQERVEVGICNNNNNAKVATIYPMN